MDTLGAERFGEEEYQKSLYENGWIKVIAWNEKEGINSRDTAEVKSTGFSSTLLDEKSRREGPTKVLS